MDIRREVRRTTCNRDCPDACSVLVSVEGGRATMLRGDPDDPVTQGFLCERTSRFLDRQHDPSRFTAPLLRRGGLEAPLLPIGWDEALDLAAQRLLAIREQSGPAAILNYRSGGSLGLLKTLVDLLFERFGPVTIKRGDICSGAGEAAQEQDFGVSESSDLFDLLNSRTIVLWGKNVHTSNVHLLPVLRRAKAAGAALIGFDPVRTRAAELCELFLQPRPGADFALAMGLARWLFDHDAIDPQASRRCEHLDEFRALAMAHGVSEWAGLADVASADLERAAELYARGPSAILVGWGLGRRRNGSLTTRALDALCAISGNLGRSGGGVSYYFRRRSAFDTSFVRGLQAAPRSFAEARLGREILEAADPPIRAIWVTAGNPVSMLPDSGSVRAAFQRSEFNVVVDTHPTDTTDVAHLVLPTLTLLEDSDLLGAYGNHWLRTSEPAVSPPGTNGDGLRADHDGPRHELHILQGLAARLGLADVLAGSLDYWKRRLLARLQPAGVGLERLRQGPTRNPFVESVLFADGRVDTPSGRVNLLAQAPLPPPRTDAQWPLTLLAASTPKAQSSQWSITLPPGPAELRVHPDSAAGANDGERCRLESRVAAIDVIVRHDPTLRRDVALMAKGGMLRDGRCANLLVSAIESDDGGGAAYYDELVRVVRVGGG